MSKKNKPPPRSRIEKLAEEACICATNRTVEINGKRFAELPILGCEFRRPTSDPDADDDQAGEE